MKRPEIKRILVPVDFSPTGQLALEQSIFMARLFKADLFILHVIEMIEFIYTAYDPASVLVADTEEIEKAVTRNMEEEAEKIKKIHGLEVTSLISRGTVSQEVTEAAKDNKIDIIIMGTHGAKGFEEYFIGSNAHKIINISPCPIITLQSHFESVGFKNIVLPIDDSLHSRQKVDYAIQMASHYGAFIHLLGLIRTDQEVDEHKFMVKIEMVIKAIKNANIAYSSKIVYGRNLAVETMQFSDKIKADLIVIMTDHESQLTGMFLGAFAKQIINHSRIPVMSIKPIEGHYDPIDLSASPNPSAHS